MVRSCFFIIITGVIVCAGMLVASDKVVNGEVDNLSLLANTAISREGYL